MSCHFYFTRMFQQVFKALIMMKPIPFVSNESRRGEGKADKVLWPARTFHQSFRFVRQVALSAPLAQLFQFNFKLK